MKHTTFILLLLVGINTAAQQISNIRFEQEGRMINIYYDLSGDYSFEVKIYCSLNNGITWDGPLSEVTGDVRKEQRAGTNKKIVWDVLAEREKLQSDVSFKISAYCLMPNVDDQLGLYIPSSKDNAPSGAKEEDLQIYLVVESMPIFPGGEANLHKFLAENIKYPQIAKESGIQGRVFVTFVVERDGSVTDARVLRSIGGGCDEEAIRVIKSMPPWNPGKNRGIPVRVQYNLPVKFTLQ